MIAAYHSRTGRIDVTMIDLVVDRKKKGLQNLGTADARGALLPADIAAFLDTLHAVLLKASSSLIADRSSTAFE